MAIQLKHVSKSYDGVPVLEDVNVTIQDGEFFVIVGPSGCGKSTLLRMISGLIPVSGGDVVIDDQVANDLAPKERNLSMVFQSYALFPFLSVRDNVAFGLKARKMPADEIKNRVDKAIEMVNLVDFETRKPAALSGGQRQRVALARAIASDAKVCLMDEPLSNLDAQLRAKMRLELKELQRQLGITVIYVTHDQVEAMTMADRVMVLNDARVQQLDTPISIYNRPNNEFVSRFFGTPQINLLTAEAEGDDLKVNDQLVFKSRRVMPDSGKYTVGIRPDDLKVVVDTRDSNARVLSVSYLGDRTVATAKLTPGEEIRLVVSNKLSIRDDDLIRIEGAKKLFVFDSNNHTYVFDEEEVPAYGTAISTQ
ncbi:ABC transporter ATP-binding protein [Lentilactobacillus sp. Marseille-Q4993]|uniref:ABC transporter ATP-binding protein n=1 Tax=Lentilactobacillus sp. Marseille-Q4993 TaxID=3039492 RepID=UPI0024BC89A7|nr:ABC transporter ATP-binding protein [Lentilactobacillus sp. Marseille-Q4993]